MFAVCRKGTKIYLYIILLCLFALYIFSFFLCVISKNGNLMVDIFEKYLSLQNENYVFQESVFIEMLI